MFWLSFHTLRSTVQHFSILLLESHFRERQSRSYSSAVHDDRFRSAPGLTTTSGFGELESKPGIVRITQQVNPNVFRGAFLLTKQIPRILSADGDVALELA